MASANQFDVHSEDYVKNMRIRFREQAARFLEDVSFDVGAVLARDLSLQDEDTKNKLSELQKGLSEQVQHMQKVITKEKSVLIASAVHRHKKDIHFTQNELKTLQEIAKQENDPNGVVTMFLKRREEGVARNRYKEFVKRAEAKYFEHRRDGRKGKFDFRHIIRDSMHLSTNQNIHHHPENKKHSKANRIPKLTMPGISESKDASTASIHNSDLTRSETSISSVSDNTVTIRSAPNMFSARLASYRSPHLSARWNPRSQLDPDIEAIRQILDELAETVELLFDFEHQPFHTAVPPQYHFYHQSLDSVGEMQPEKSEEGEPAVSEFDEDRNDDDDTITGEAGSHLSEDQPNDGGEPMQNLEYGTNEAEARALSDAISEESNVDDRAVSQDLENVIEVDAINIIEENEEPMQDKDNRQPINNTVLEEVLKDTEVQEVMQEVLAIEMQSIGDDIDDISDNDIERESAQVNTPELETASIPAEKLVIPAVRRTRSNQAQKYMAPKKLHVEPIQRCHRKNRDTKTTTPNQRRNGNRSRSPWRHPERFPQIRDVQSRPNTKKQLKSLGRNQSTTKLPEAK